MSDRTVAVELRIKAAQFIAGTQAAKKAVREMGAETLKATKQNHASMQTLGRSGLVAGGLIAGGMGLAVKASMDFEKSLSGVRAVAGATSGEMDKLKTAAIAAGQATVFSASDAATAEAELAKAGISVADILGGGLRGSLDLAAAGQIGLADSATIAAQAMNVFKLKGADVGHIADVLAAGANKSAADVGQLGQALQQGGLLAAQTGLSLEDTVGALSAFADNALIGSDAGTSLKTMLQRLVPQSTEAKAAMDKIGFSAYDAQGNFVGLESVAGQLQAGLGKLSAEQRASALSTIFGSDAVRAANVLYEDGAAGVRDYVGAVNDQGAAARMAGIQLDNLAGDLEQLKGSIETALIKSGSAGNDSLRGMAQGATGAVNAVSGLPGPLQKAGFALGTIGSAGLLTVGALGTMIPKVRETRTALEGMGRAGAAANRGMAGLGKMGAYGAIAAAAAVGLHALTVEVNKLAGNKAPKVDALTNSLAAFGDTGKISGEVAAQFGQGLDHLNADVAHVSGWGAKFNTGLGLLPSQADNSRKALHGLDESLVSLVSSGNTAGVDKLFARFVANGGDLVKLKAQLPGYTGALLNADTQQKLAAGSAGTLGTALGDVVAPAVTSAADALKAYTDALADTVAIDAYTSAAELAKSFHDLGKELKDGGKVTNAEKITLGGFAAKVKQTAATVLDQSHSQKQANKAARDGRVEFEALAVKAGYSATAAHRLALRLIEIPKRTDVTITADIDPALAQIRHLQRALQATGLGAALSAGIAAKVTHNHPKGQARGGPVVGPGSGTSDSVPRMLSNGEFVVNAGAASRHRGLLEGINSGGQPANGGYSGGGATIVRVPMTENNNTTHSSPIHIENLNGGLAEVSRQQRLNHLRAGQARQRRQS